MRHNGDFLGFSSHGPTAHSWFYLFCYLLKQTVTYIQFIIIKMSHLSMKFTFIK